MPTSVFLWFSVCYLFGVCVCVFLSLFQHLSCFWSLYANQCFLMVFCMLLVWCVSVFLTLLQYSALFVEFVCQPAFSCGFSVLLAWCVSVFLSLLQYPELFLEFVCQPAFSCGFSVCYLLGVCLCVSAHVSTLSRRPTIDKEQVEEDLQTVGQISDLCSRLAAAHQVRSRVNGPAV